MQPDSPDTPRRRVLATCAALGALATCAALGTLASRIWHGADAPAWVRGVTDALTPTLGAAPGAASRPGTPPPVYFAVGRAFVLVYAALAVRWTLRPVGPVWMRRSLAVLLGLAALGDVLAYWVSAWAGPAVRAVGFWRIEVPALLLALLVIGARGVALLRAGAAPARTAWTLALAPVVAIAGTAALRYMPHGPVLGLCVAALAGAQEDA